HSAGATAHGIAEAAADETPVAHGAVALPARNGRVRQAGRIRNAAGDSRSVTTRNVAKAAADEGTNAARAVLVAAAHGAVGTNHVRAEKLTAAAGAGRAGGHAADAIAAVAAVDARCAGNGNEAQRGRAAHGNRQAHVVGGAQEAAGVGAGVAVEFPVARVIVV